MKKNNKETISIKRKVGRPKLANEKLIKEAKRQIYLSIIFASIVFSLSGLRLMNGFMPVGAQNKHNNLAVVSLTQQSNKFVASSLSSNCVTVLVPKNAGTNWRVQLFNKAATASSFGTTPIFKGEFVSGKTGYRICFTKQKYDYETFRILVKWTTGHNDAVQTNPSYTTWKPSGWYYNASIGWAYKDYQIKFTTTPPVVKDPRPTVKIVLSTTKEVQTGITKKVTKDTVVYFNATFNKNGTKKTDFWRKWVIYIDGTKRDEYSSACTKISDKQTVQTKITINNATIKQGAWEIYSNSSCGSSYKTSPDYKTNKYTKTTNAIEPGNTTYNKVYNQTDTQIIANLNKTLTGVMKNNGYWFVYYAKGSNNDNSKSYDRDPYLAAAIAMHESHYGYTCRARDYFNVGEIPGSTYTSIQKGIKGIYSLMGSYKYQSLTLYNAPVNGANGYSSAQWITIQLAYNTHTDYIQQQWINSTSSYYSKIKAGTAFVSSNSAPSNWPKNCFSD